MLEISQTANCNRVCITKKNIESYMLTVFLWWALGDSNPGPSGYEWLCPIKITFRSLKQVLFSCIFVELVSHTLQ